MRYVISDIHGRYDQYLQLLKKINFSLEDDLYILGDVVDRGPEPIKVLQDIMQRPNVIFILGNHELMMYLILKRLSAEITEENCETQLTAEIIAGYQLWMQNGGATTAQKFRQLPRAAQQEILDYISDASLYETIIHNGRKYILVHAGLAHFSQDKALTDYDIYDFLEVRTDYSRRYYPDANTYLVTGHTPTMLIDDWNKPEVYQKNGHIAIDCGCSMGGQLAAYCIETGGVTYVRGRYAMLDEGWDNR